LWKSLKKLWEKFLVKSLTYPLVNPYRKMIATV
jgi:hypothetical protein